MSANTAGALERFEGIPVTVIGDAILDGYLEGTADRVCREAPVPVVVVEREVMVPGGAANMAANLAALGGDVTFVTIVGGDDAGYSLIRLLEGTGVDCSRVLVERGSHTVTKKRLICDGAIVARFDHVADLALDRVGQERAPDAIAAAMRGTRATVLSDYGGGLFCPASISTIAQTRRPGIQLIVDSPRLEMFSALEPDVVKPNVAEAIAQTGTGALPMRANRVATSSRLGAALLKRSRASLVALTMDSDGAWLFDKGGGSLRIEAAPVAEPHPAGAGDTFLAAFTLARLAGCPARDAGEIAAAAAAIACEHPRTSVCSLAELKASFSADHKRVASLDELREVAESHRGAGHRIVLTNGCFDILHPGHVALLEQARSLGDVLFVAVNTDASIKRLKGESRPINTLDSRLSVLGGLASVDHTFAFGTDTAVDVVKTLRPDVYVKGGDYRAQDIPEGEAVLRLGGKVEILPFFGQDSTTSVIRRLQEKAVLA